MSDDEPREMPEEPAEAAPAPGPPAGGATGVVRWRTWIRRLLYGCIGFELLWPLLDELIEFQELISNRNIHHIVDMSLEENAPTWFASLQASMVALTVFGIYFAAVHSGASKWTRRGWMAIACFFAYIGFDDAAKFHERVGTTVGDFFASDPESNILPVQWLLNIETYNWQRFLLPIFASVGLFIFFFLWKHFGKYRLRWFMLIGMSCLATAVFMDFLEGKENFFWDVADMLGVREDTVSHHSKMIEETLEMFGTTMFWQGFLRYLSYVTDGMKLRFTR
jgi:hypothetical protein